MTQFDLIDEGWHSAKHRDVASAGMGPAHHYAFHGAAERRDVRTAAYVAAHPGVDFTRVNPLWHAHEGKAPPPRPAA